MRTNEFSKKMLDSVINHAIDKMRDGAGIDCYGCDLHNELFNRDYFIIGYHEAEKWITDCGMSIFEAIETVVEYEKDNFGETNTGINAESISNMLAYIIGEIFLGECEHLIHKWDVRLTERDCNKIIKQLEKQLK